jgi:hypothetical protein
MAAPGDREVDVGGRDGGLLDIHPELGQHQRGDAVAVRNQRQQQVLRSHFCPVPAQASGRLRLERTRRGRRRLEGWADQALAQALGPNHARKRVLQHLAHAQRVRHPAQRRF